MEKIFVTKNEDIASVVEKVLETGDESIVLVIPRASRLLGSLANFHLVKREADSVGKKILIESVDDQILALAKASGLEAVNPFLSGPRRPVSDIVSRSVVSDAGRPAREPEGEGRPQFASRLRSKLRRNAPTPSADGSHKELPAEAGIPVEEMPGPEPLPAETGSSRRPRLYAGVRAWGWKRLLKLAVLGAVVIAAVATAGIVLPRADITVTRKKQSWSLEETITAATRVAAVSPAALQVPAQLFLENRNVRLSFPASGRKTVERKAAGTATVYNAYSSEKQSLVASTRLLTPEGKIFRLVKGITVPGARVEEGKIISSSIDVEVIADKPGADYNIGPVSRFTIPGFQGSPKYQGFYAESKAPMTGGFIGEVALPSPEDLVKGREEITRTLKDMLSGFLRSQLPKEFMAPEGGTRFRIVKETVIDDTDEEGKFSIFAEAEMKMLAFRESDVKALAVALARKEEGEETEPVEFTLSFGAVSADFDAGRLQIPTTYQGVFAEHIDPGLFRERAAGKSEADLRTLIATLPGFESAKISLWPFWVRRVPSNVERVDVKIE